MDEHEQPQLAEITEGFLDQPTFLAYLDDLDACAQVLDVLVKGGARTRTDATPVSLREAADDLMHGRTHGVQVRYRYQGCEWRDTLLWSPQGLRVVRMNMDDLQLG